MAKGLWLHFQQLPKNMDKRLLSRPWHEVPASISHWGASVSSSLNEIFITLSQYTPRLRNEYLELKRLHKLERDNECLHRRLEEYGLDGKTNHESGTCGGNGEGSSEQGGDTYDLSKECSGGWQKYEVNAFWHDERGLDGCSKATPIACTMLKRLREISWLPILRAGNLPQQRPPSHATLFLPKHYAFNNCPIFQGYSRLGPGTEIIPHYGSGACHHKHAHIKAHVCRTNFPPNYPLIDDTGVRTIG